MGGGLEGGASVGGVWGCAGLGGRSLIDLGVVTPVWCVSSSCPLVDLGAGPRVQLYPELVVTSPVESHEQVSSSQILPHDNLSPR